MKKFAILGIMILMAACPMGRTPGPQIGEINWAPLKSRTLTYEVKHDVGIKAGQPKYTVTRTQRLIFDGQENAKLERDGAGVGMFEVTAGGHIKALRPPAVPDHDLAVLMHFLPTHGADAQVGAEWESKYPSDAVVLTETDVISLQDRFRSKITNIQVVGTSRVADIDVQGDVRLVENLALRTVKTGMDNEDLQTVDKLVAYVPNLEGTIRFDITNNHVVSADLYVLMMPRPISRADLRTSEHVRHITYAVQTP